LKHILSEILLPIHFRRVVALAAVNGSSGCWLEGYFGIFAAARADCRIHLAGWLRLVCHHFVLLSSFALAFFADLPASGTAFGCVDMAFSLKLGLLFGCELIFVAAVEAFERFFLVSRRMTS
jgi:hypothetical protein